MLALPRLNSDHRHARVDKQPGHKGDGDTLSPPALVVFGLRVTQGMKSSRQSWSRHGLHFKGAFSPTLQSDSLRSTSISLPGCNPRWNPGQVSGEWGATLGVNKPPTAFLRRADDSNKNLSSSALWGARVPFPGGNCFTAHCRQWGCVSSGEGLPGMWVGLPAGGAYHGVPWGRPLGIIPNWGVLIANMVWWWDTCSIHGLPHA